MKITKTKRGKYNVVFYDKDNNITRVDNRVNILELVEISKKTIIKK